ncbi:MAG TPA: 50S ribosomal protein L10 [Saprospiraceae bacterium]|nr:50S ribosomal protein L10 [Saprospiraceae bacterium]
MNKEQKTQEIESLKKKFESANFFYLTDSSTLTVAQVNQFRRMCFEKGIEMQVVKNTLAKKALQSFGEERGFEPLYSALEGPTAILFTENASTPAKLIEEFRKSNEKPVLKAAYIDTAVYSGDDQIKVLVSLKSKEDLIGDVIMLLQSPMKNVIGALKSGGNTIAGLVKALEERGNS